MNEDKKPPSVSESEKPTSLSETVLHVSEASFALKGLLSVADALHDYREQNSCLMDQLTHAVNLFENIDHQLDLSEVIGIQSSALDVVQQVRDDSLIAFSSELTNKLSTQSLDIMGDRSFALHIAEQVKDESLSALSIEISERLDTQLGLSGALKAESPFLSVVNQIREESLLNLANDFSEIISAQLDSPGILATESPVFDVVKQLRDECLLSPAADLSAIVSSQPDLLNVADIGSSVLGIADRLQEESLVFLSGNLSAIAESQFISPDIFAVQSSAVDILQTANCSIGHLFDISETINELAVGRLSAVSPEWLDQVHQAIPIVESSLLLDTSLQPHLSRISELSILTQASVACLPWNDIGSAIELEDSERITIQNNFLELAESYSNFFGSLEREPLAIASLSPIASGFPSVELFNETRLMGAITVRSDDYTALLAETEEIRNEIRSETSDALSECLRGLDRELVELLHGARHALYSDHPDHIRHFATSFRELFTHVLHMLASDESIRRWTSDPAHYHDNRPTRRARLLYICRNVNHGPFTGFIEQDIRAMLEFAQLFQRGTHRITPGYTREQLTAMSVRMESSLRFIIEVSRSST
jgi:hypothetical protein